MFYITSERRFFQFKGVIYMSDRNLELNKNFIPVESRPVAPGLAEFHTRPNSDEVNGSAPLLTRPVEGAQVEVLPGRIIVGRVDTTRQTLK